ncbi:ParB-like nuclease domain protein [Mycobacterium phage Tourach]|uniref:ParB-like nuclease domain protein n=1 Tax=Mycobacterium phage Tourach TaxID=2599882 RepID=A0A5J6U0S7_9CAUD|nr:ParB-like nuclease domain protein [Mycobacterium phage Tourach]QFG14302.1 ParB-like nuclease domain protein [Mycobacterium phage Tourach]
MSEPELWDARRILENFKVGHADHGWHEELQAIWYADRERTWELLDEVGDVGRIVDPVIIDRASNQVWDGHHRIAVGLALLMPVPLVYREQGDR